MKKVFATLIFAVMLAACDIDKVYINGNLDGMWQLGAVDSLGQPLCNPTGVYYSFQRHMAQVSKHYDEEIPLRFLANLNYKGSVLTISGMRRYLEEEKRPTIDELRLLCLPSDSVTFNILALSDERLIMSCGDYTYSLRKW